MDNKNESVKLNIPHALIAMFMSALIYVIIAYLCELTPFGNNTWVSYDMKRQYVDFYSFFKHIISGDNSLFYSFNTALGSDIFGFSAYYLASPFIFIIALFPKELFPLAITLVFGLKLSLSAFTMDVFLQKYCKKGSYLCAVSYSLCGFVVSNGMNLMWMDVIIMIPIVILMTERLLKDGKLVGYILSVTAILYFNYYIAYMTIIFAGLWIVVRMIANKEKNPSQALFRFGMATVAAAGIDAVFLIPTFLELRDSPKDISNVENAISHVGVNFEQVVSKLFSLSYDSLEIYWGAPMLFCGIAILIFTLLFFLNKKIPLLERLSMLILLAIFAVSFFNVRVNLLWHGGMEPSGYTYRETIMCVFVILVCACRSIQKCKDGITIPRFVLAMLCLGVSMFFAFRKPQSYMYDWKIIINIAIVLVLFVLIGLLVFSKKRQTSLIAIVLIMVIQCADLGLNAVYIYKIESLQQETASDFAQKISDIDKTVNAVKALDDSFYRMETWSPREQNDGMMFNYNGVTHYSGHGKVYVRDMLKKMGYNDDGLYTDYGYNNTQTADSILGVKYLLTDAAHAQRMHKDYELVVDGKIQAYRNPYALPIGIGVYREMSGESMDPFSFQEEIYTRLVGEYVEIFEPAEVKVNDIVSSRPEKEFEVAAAISGDMYFYIADIIDNLDNMEIYINDEFVSYYGNNSCLKVIDLGYYEKGETVYIKIKSDDEDKFGNPLFVTENTKALAAAYNKVADRFASISMVSSSHIKMTLDSAYTVGDEISGQVGIFATIPYEKGWNVNVAGTKVTPVEAYDSLMYIPVTEAIQQVELEPGENLEVDMHFIPEGFWLGLCVTSISILIIILVARLKISEADYFEYDEDDESNIIRTEST